MKGRVKISSNPPHPNPWSPTAPLEAVKPYKTSPLPTGRQAQGEKGFLGNPKAELRGILLIKQS